MQSSAKVTEVEMSSELMQQLMELPDKRPGRARLAWTKEMDEALVYGWERKGHAATAEILGVGTKTCLRRYKELKGE